MTASILSVSVITIMIAGSAALYLLPVLIGLARRLPDIGPLAVINILLGWTLLGWAAALAMALRTVHPAPPAVIVQNFPPPQPWPPQLAGAGWAGPPGPPPPRLGDPPPLVLPAPPHDDQPDYIDQAKQG